MRVLQVVKWFHFEVIGHPRRLDDEEVLRHLPLLEQKELISVLAEVLAYQVQLFLVHGFDLLLIKDVLKDLLLVLLPGFSRLEDLALLLHDGKGNLLSLANVVEELLLGVVDQTVVAVDKLTDLALVDGTVTTVVAFLASLARLVVALQ